MASEDDDNLPPGSHGVEIGHLDDTNLCALARDATILVVQRALDKAEADRARGQDVSIGQVLIAVRANVIAYLCHVLGLTPMELGSVVPYLADYNQKHQGCGEDHCDHGQQPPSAGPVVVVVQPPQRNGPPGRGPRGKREIQ